MEVILLALMCWGPGNKFSNTVRGLQTADKRVVICDVQESRGRPRRRT